MDGARFANAVVSLGVPPGAITHEVGVDVLCFGGTKNGLGLGDVIVFFDSNLAREFPYRRKQAGQLQAKMRFVAAAWAACLQSGGWRHNAEQANAMARLLESRLRKLPGVQILYPVQANSVFLRMPPRWAEGLHQRGWHFYTVAGGQRLMCSWDTQEADIDALVQDIHELQGDRYA
jgi:threonine aldolase